MKYLTFLAVLSLVFSVAVFAQTDDLPDAGVTPDSPMYFLKSWKESVQMFFTFGAENKAKQFLHLADVRLAEYQKMIEGGKTDIAERTLAKYGDQLNRALEKANEVGAEGAEKLKEAIGEKILSHEEALQKILEKVPEQAREGIKNAIEVSRQGFENAIGAISGERKGELEKRAEEIKLEVEEKLGIMEKPPTLVGEGEPSFAPTSSVTAPVCIQVITPATGPDGKCKEFGTPCEVPAGWRKVDKCPVATTVAPTSVSTPAPIPISAPTPVSIPAPIPISAPAPATLVACCSASGGCKLVDTKETCLGASGKLASVSSCSPNPCPQPTPVYNGCKQGPMKDYKCPDGTLIKWLCTCEPKPDGEEARYCSVEPVKSCAVSVSAAPLAITWIEIRHLLWMTKDWTLVEHIFFKTNVPATAHVEYGLTTSYGFTMPASPPGPPTTQHVAQGIPGQRNATYHFRIIAEDAQGNKIVSDDYTFTTGL